MKNIFQTAGKLMGIFTLLVLSANTIAAGLLTPKSGGLDPLELSEHHVDVLVEDGYAVTTVTQIFSNPHSNNLEAIYSFPVPTKGAVGEFSVWIDGKQVTGEVVKKEKAREIYNQEKAAGNEVGITEKNGFKTFETSVYPVRAGQDTKIQIRYYQPAEVDLGIGRWVYQLEEGGVDEEALSFWDTDTKVTKAFSFNFKIRSSYPINALRLPNHAQAQVVKINDNEWHVSMTKQGNSTVKQQISDDRVSQQMAEAYAKAHPLEVEQESNQNQSSQKESNGNAAAVFKLDKDLVVYWRLQEGLPGNIELTTYRPDPSKKGTFMMVFTPGDELTPITQGADWNFVLDISGSMEGKFSSLVEGVSRSIKKMRPQDRFRIILFNDNARELTNGYAEVTPENLQHYLALLSSITPNNGTNLYAGLKQGLDSIDADKPTGIILVTDGVANVGTTRKDAFFKLLEKSDVRLFTFIMGNSANQPLLEPLARHSGGFALNISNSDDIIGRVLQATEKLSHKAFHDVEVTIDGAKVSDLTPHTVGSLYQGQQLIVMGHYWKSGDAKVTIKTKLSGQKKAYSTRINFAEKSQLNPELERLWAYAKINDLGERMSDFEGEDHQQAITEIALEYGLVTDYTSMLVLREEQFSTYNIKRNNKRRVENEALARKQRASQPVRQPSKNSGDKPMFKKSRPSSGGGSFDWLLLIGLTTLITLRKRG
jgi:Ca-activated chloride channel family protein